MLRKLFLWGSRSDWLRRHVASSRLGRRAVLRFMPGETLQDALGAADGFRTSGIATVLTNLGENVTDPDQATEVPSRDELLLLYRNLAARGLGGFESGGAPDNVVYWTSSQISADMAGHVDLPDLGRVHFDDKDFPRRVRAIRAF